MLLEIKSKSYRRSQKPLREMGTYTCLARQMSYRSNLKTMVKKAKQWSFMKTRGLSNRPAAQERKRGFMSRAI